MSSKVFYVTVAAGALCAYLAAGTALAAPPTADQPPQPTAQVGEVIVTAQKRAERLSRVPAAVTAITADQLNTSGVSSDRDLVGRVPGLQVSSTIGSGSFVIRGINTGVDSTPTVGTQIDGAPVGGSTAASAGSLLLPLIDPSAIARVEVLRGPQGTVYAGNTLGGIVNYVTTRPNLNHFDDSFYVEGSGTDDGGGNGVLRGMVTGPIVSDKLGLQISGFVNRQSGFINATSDGRSDYDYNHAYGGRAALLWQATPDLRIEVSDLYSDVKAYSDEVIGNPANNRRAGPDLTLGETVLPYYANRYNTVLGTADLDLHWSTISYVGTYQHNNAHYAADLALGPIESIVTGLPAFGGVPLAADAPIGTAERSHTDKITQELRLTSPDSGRIRWLVGTFYNYESNYLAETIGVFNPNQSLLSGPPGDILTAAIPTRLTEAAGFGDLDFYLTPRLDVTGGVRVSHISQDYQQLTGGSDFAAENALFGVLGYSQTPPVSAESFNDRTIESYLANIKYQLTPQTMAYFRFATGFRVGGPNTLSPGLPASYGPDETYNYEAGVKSSFFRGRGYVELTVFDVEWSSIQVDTISASGENGQINGGGAYCRGVELDGTLRPIEGLSLMGSITYDKAELKNDIITGVGVIGLKGDSLPNVPKWAGSFSSEYERPISGEWRGFLAGQLRYNGNRNYVPQSSTTYPPYELPSYILVDLRAGLRYHVYEAAVFVRNASNARAELGAFSEGAPFVELQRPRTIGVSLSGKF